MRLALLCFAVGVTVAACGGASKSVAENNSDSGPFVDHSGFQPTAFSAKVTGHGRPVIFIPGVGCPGDVWDDTVARLGDGVQAHVLTLAGFAGTEPIKPPLAAKTRRELI